MRESEPLRDAMDRFRVFGGHASEHPPLVYAIWLSGADVPWLREVADGITYDGVLAADRLLGRVQLHPARVVYQRRDWNNPGFDPVDYAATVQSWHARLSA